MNSLTPTPDLEHNPFSKEDLCLSTSPSGESPRDAPSIGPRPEVTEACVLTDDEFLTKVGRRELGWGWEGLP